jgi:enoyl-CoA hydratase
MSAPETPVTTETRGHALIITINRPQARNAVDSAVAREIAAATGELDRNTELRVGVLTGAGGAFSAGMDLKAAARGESSSAAGKGFAGLVEAPPRKPLVAAVEGPAMGGGFEMALACDLVVAGDNARFALPEVKRGLIAGGGGALRLPRRIPHHLAMELLLTGRAIPAGRAAELGVVNRVCADGDALDEALVLADEVASNAPLALEAVKRVVHELSGAPEPEAFEAQREQIRALRESADFAEGARAFSERRAPQWTGR